MEGSICPTVLTANHKKMDSEGVLFICNICNMNAVSIEKMFIHIQNDHHLEGEILTLCINIIFAYEKTIALIFNTKFSFS